MGLEQTTVESLCGRSISGLALVLTLMSHDHGCQLSFTTFFFDETDTLRRSCCCFDVQAGSVQPHSLASRLLLYLLYRSQWPTRGKGKGLDTCYSATYTWVRLVTSSALQSRKWQLIGMSYWCRSALCGHLLPALTDNWTHSAASRHTIAPNSHTGPSPLHHTRPRKIIQQLSCLDDILCWFHHSTRNSFRTCVYAFNTE